MRLKTLATLIGIIYVIFSIYTVFVLFYNDDRRLVNSEKIANKAESTKEIGYQHLDLNKNSKGRKPSKTARTKGTSAAVEIWGKAAIGLYLWQHIFEAPLESLRGDFLKYGEFESHDLIFRFRTGPMITPQNVDKNVQNAVLFINGREPKKVKFALTWLDYIKQLNNLKNFAIVLLGNEQCNNDWLMPYMKVNGGFINFAFIIYDVPYIDDKNFHPWPLGVATYRNFPVIHGSLLKLQNKRKYTCNFLGTTYENSSRSELLDILNSQEFLRDSCWIRTRSEWLPSETEHSSELYQNALRDSDLTLCPVGKNTECYRIYEAISYGSVPIVEDVLTTGNCGQSGAGDFAMVPLRILKRMNAPVIYVKSWKELPRIIANENNFSFEYKVKRRKELVQWYDKFKYDLKNNFVQELKNGFNFQ